MATPRGILRFTPHTFRVSNSSHDVRASPRKRQKTDLAHKWEMASQMMLNVEEEENDGLPNILSSFDGSFSAVKNKQKSLIKRDAKGKGKLVETNIDVDMDRWSPPPCDPTLQIPGELVLARPPRNNKFWPAKLIAYIPPTKATQKSKFTVKFLDELEYDLTRDRFYTSEEPGFVDCELGKFESEMKDANDDDESASESEATGEGRGRHRAESPVPKSPIPEDFEGLGMREQLAYVKPVLSAVLNELYAPALDRHRRFLKGGAARDSLQEGAAVRGTLSPAEIRKLQSHLCEWVLREEKRAKVMIDVGEQNVNGIGIEPSVQVETQSANGPAEVPVEEGEVPMSQGNIVEVAKVEPPSAQDVQSQPLAAEEALIVDEQPPPAAAPETLEQLGDSLSAEPQAIPELSMVDKHEDHEAKETDANSVVASLPRTESCYPPRQRGCEGYEALSGVEKLSYCANILLPEAVHQILLWRTGERTSVDLLSADEEKKLHDAGVSMANEQDWVFGILHLRDAQARLRDGIRESKAIVPPVAPAATGGTRSRPRRATVSRR
ncbi:hypothetical protein SERLA73DRAFT_186864 [Serpula lacrymans var. lacrymans S7.3]|uniref:PWWP domain-containing protein n=2 Tax=Serpula lacrymans var. lacrymans TaxID=341189 RepID=F8Q800_SERL3|nr:uncharacterized protein SERLADRAFT_476129 [Serpula lacrymans var. lacrymans S7.9]EGN95688.1 hypothetical protein SERLA73DRAFT_186864 [Serpula lacrymans var. lacrymans S7.3]EGO21214.1 hypothetical protein SERLADRAFT_476129 [Serpula lacrymans var. lacrymans S7.9]